MKPEEAIKKLRLFVDHESYTDDFQDMCRTAIAALEKQIPTKVNISSWNPARCPSCGEELSEHLGDGYYRHRTFLEVCPNPECCQRLDWGE